MSQDKDQASLLFANDSFYRAFISRDMAIMNALWATNAHVSCIHPGWPPLEGREAVMQSWHAILTGPNAPNIECRGARVSVHGDTGLIICYEKISGEYLIATNVFIRANAGWLMVHHQSGPTPDPGDRTPSPSRSLN
jgi:hypothetical protein